MLAMTAGTARGESDDERLAAFFRAHLDESFRLRPVDATMLGDHRFDHLLDDVSPAARQRWLDHTKAGLAALDAGFATAEFTPAGRLDHDILRDDLVRGAWLAENERPFETDPRVYGTYTTDSVFSLLTQSTLPKETNVTSAIARMRLIPALVETARAALANPPPTVLETAIQQNRGSIAFYERQLFELVGDSPQLPALREAAAPVVAALGRHQAFLEKELLPRARGEWRLGRE